MENNIAIQENETPDTDQELIQAAPKLSYDTATPEIQKRLREMTQEAINTGNIEELRDFMKENGRKISLTSDGLIQNMASIKVNEQKTRSIVEGVMGALNPENVKTVVELSKVDLTTKPDAPKGNLANKLISVFSFSSKKPKTPREILLETLNQFMSEEEAAAVYPSASDSLEHKLEEMDKAALNKEIVQQIIDTVITDETFKRSNDLANKIIDKLAHHTTKAVEFEGTLPIVMSAIDKMSENIHDIHEGDRIMVAAIEFAIDGINEKLAGFAANNTQSHEKTVMLHSSSYLKTMQHQAKEMESNSAYIKKATDLTIETMMRSVLTLQHILNCEVPQIKNIIASSLAAQFASSTSSMKRSMGNVSAGARDLGTQSMNLLIHAMSEQMSHESVVRNLKGNTKALENMSKTIGEAIDEFHNSAGDIAAAERAMQQAVERVGRQLHDFTHLEERRAIEEATSKPDEHIEYENPEPLQ